MGQEKHPAIGTRLYFVCEHHYYRKGSALVNLEYAVCGGELTEYLQSGEMHVLGKDPDGYMIPHYFKPQDIGKTVFYTAKEAAQLAQKRADHYDRACGASGAPMRRPWAHLLEE